MNAAEMAKEIRDVPLESISPAAWSAALLIDGVVEEVMRDCGVERQSDGRDTIPAIAKIVQYAIELHAVPEPAAFATKERV